MLQAISQGFVQREIQESSYRYQHSVESGECTIVGVNRFVSEDRPGIRIHQDRSWGRKGTEVERLARVRAARDSKAWRAGPWTPSRKRPEAGRISFPVMIRAVECQVTLGEISDRLRTIFGEHRENPQI